MTARFAHIAVVVDDMDAALAFWQGALGLPLHSTEQHPDEAVEVAFLPFGGGGTLELVRPTDDASGVARYLAKRGAGVHHLCVAVDDLEGTMARLGAAGAELINEVPRTRADGTRYAFVHPRSTGGVLLELYEGGGSHA